MIKIAETGLILTLSFILIIHTLILLKMIPYKIVWGGRLKSDAEMYRFEGTSIVVNIVLLIVAFVKAGILTVAIPGLYLKIILWAMAGLFLLNTIANIKSLNKYERWIFSPITILLTLFCAILAMN